MSKPVCGDCKWFDKDPNDFSKGIGYCHKLPPQVIMVPTQDRLSGQMSAHPVGMFPPVQKKNFGCSQFEANLEVGEVH